MRLPTVGGTIICKSAAVKNKWDIIHTAMLMLNTDEVLFEQSSHYVLDFFLFLLIKCEMIDLDKAEVYCLLFIP